MILYSSADHPADAPPFILPDPLPRPPRKVKASPPVPDTPLRVTLKRSAPDAGDDDGIIDLEPTPKRPKTMLPANDVIASPSKKRKLDEDGLILMDGRDDRLDDDVIEID
jgi:ubiquitin-like 1-activating enzyme E1 B